MNYQEFYERYRISKTDLAYLAGVGTRTLIKYCNGQSIRENSKLRIEKTIYVIEKYNLVRPHPSEGHNHADSRANSEHHQKILKWEKTFRELLAKEP